MRSDFAFFFSSRDIIYLHYFTEVACLSVLHNTTQKVRPCQIGETLFEDCTRTLLSPSGVSEETQASPPKKSRDLYIFSTYTYTSIPSIPHSSTSTFLPPPGHPTNVLCATVSSTLDRNKKRRETINLDKNTTDLLCMQYPALTA